jgi:Rrf2 family protein
MFVSLMLGKTGLHAVKAFAILATAEGGTFLGAQAIAERIRAPGNYLGKLLQVLARAGLVEGRKGLQGGFRLARLPDQISLYDVVEPIEHVSRWHGCFLGRGSCREDRPCRLHARWAEVRDTYVKFLRETTIQDVAAGGEDISSALTTAPETATSRQALPVRRAKRG